MVSCWYDVNTKSIIVSNFLAFLVWCLLLVLCWPVALLALILYPLVWVLLIPFRLVGMAVGGVLAFIKTIICFPTRVLARRPNS